MENRKNVEIELWGERERLILREIEFKWMIESKYDVLKRKELVETFFKMMMLLVRSQKGKSENFSNKAKRKRRKRR